VGLINLHKIFNEAYFIHWNEIGTDKSAVRSMFHKIFYRDVGLEAAII
jgi:hypothetical protein